MGLVMVLCSNIMASMGYDFGDTLQHYVSLRSNILLNQGDIVFHEIYIN